LMKLIPVRPSSRWLHEGGVTALIAALILGDYIEGVEGAQRPASRGVNMNITEYLNQLVIQGKEVLVHLENGFEIARAIFTILGVVFAVILFLKDQGNFTWLRIGIGKRKTTEDKEVQVETFHVGQYGLLTVDYLMAECIRRNLRHDGNKEDLAWRLSCADHYMGPDHTHNENTPYRDEVQQDRVGSLPAAVRARQQDREQARQSGFRVNNPLPPTQRQTHYIRVLAERRGVAIPEETYVDRAAATIFLDQLEGRVR
jgi:hypothetical protein